MEPWFKQNAHHNIFTLFSQEQCRELLHRLEHQLATEQQLEQAAREIVALSSRNPVLSDPPYPQDPPLAEPHTSSPNSQTPARSQTQTCDTPSLQDPFAPTQRDNHTTQHTRTSVLTLSLAVLPLLLLWSVGLYRYAYQQGTQSPHVTAESCSHKTTLSPQPLTLACPSSLCNPSPTYSLKTPLLPEKPNFPSPSAYTNLSSWSQGLSLPSPFFSEDAEHSLQPLPWRRQTPRPTAWNNTTPSETQHVSWSKTWEKPAILQHTHDHLQLDILHNTQHPDNTRFVLLQPLQISN